MNAQADPLMQRHRRLIEGLLRAEAYPHPVDQPRLIETHISSLILTGETAYKLKKPLDLGFLDFRQSEQRAHFCAEEIRLNRRMAPEIYAGVVSIRGSLDGPHIDGEGPILEHAVRMRQFDPERTLDHLARGAAPDTAAMDDFMDRLVIAHAGFPVADTNSDYGRPATVLAPMLENFRQMQDKAPDSTAAARRQALRDWTLARYADLTSLLEQRRRQGRIRECHGDLHLGNLVLIDRRIVAFDALEFAPDLRWIDVASELAFLVMDLSDRGWPQLARRCLNRYLDASGDWSAAPLLDWYLVYRALVRAKISAIRHSQADRQSLQARKARQDFDAYVALAQSYSQPPTPRLVLMHGVSGSGKSHYAQQLVEDGGFLRLRADVERKRLAGLKADENSARAGLDLYTAEHGRRTYARLLQLTRMLLDCGRSVVVDATFLDRAQRSPFLALAAESDVECVVLELQADPALLARRIRQRNRGGGDPSEADVEIMRGQLQGRESLTPEERQQARVVTIDPAAAEPTLMALIRAPA